MKKTKLRLLLENKNMSAAKLSEKITGVSARTVQAIVQGSRQPSIEVARKIAKTLKVKIDVIFS